MAKQYEVIVGNIGTVYDGPSLLEANRAWGEYRRQSSNGYGRAAGEGVTFMVDGEPEREHMGDDALLEALEIGEQRG